ncbi:hypothetical protein EVAR_40350_1 [Eumeta japonica]|uniref:Uncharacterized protein n=1 Tax=Eumeta variegata TaxID=151549 RepID=A0A4C1XKX0_EUMVA|nr:hypothetical protein EVAR_40350_1 [Eumeta japonica]
MATRLLVKRFIVATHRHRANGKAMRCHRQTDTESHRSVWRAVIEIRRPMEDCVVTVLARIVPLWPWCRYNGSRVLSLGSPVRLRVTASARLLN